MLSRVAENAFWMYRYLERADHIRRMLSVNHFLNLGAGTEVASQWEPMIETTGGTADFHSRYTAINRQNVIAYLCLDTENYNSVTACVNQGRENARAIREKLPIEVWEAVNSIYHYLQNIDTEIVLADPMPFFNELRIGQERIIGTLHSCLSQTELWQFAQLGIHIERADKATRFLDVKYFYLLPSVSDVGGSIDILGWEAVLRSVSGLTMFRQKWKQVSAANVLEFLLFDKHFPRALLHCLQQSDQIVKSFSSQSDSDAKRYSNSAEREIGQLLAQLRYTTIDEAFKFGIHEFLNDVQIHLNKIGNAIQESFFEASVASSDLRGASQ